MENSKQKPTRHEVRERLRQEAAHMAAAGNADTCSLWLKCQGFEVLAVQKCSSNPRITIKTSPLCEQLEGAVRMYSRGPAGEKRYYVAIRFGCEVRWTEKTNADCGFRNAEGGGK